MTGWKGCFADRWPAWQGPRRRWSGSGPVDQVALPAQHLRPGLIGGEAGATGAIGPFAGKQVPHVGDGVLVEAENRVESHDSERPIGVSPGELLRVVGQLADRAGRAGEASFRKQ